MTVFESMLTNDPLDFMKITGVDEEFSLYYNMDDSIQQDKSSMPAPVISSPENGAISSNSSSDGSEETPITMDTFALPATVGSNATAALSMTLSDQNQSENVTVQCNNVNDSLATARKETIIPVPVDNNSTPAPISIAPQQWFPFPEQNQMQDQQQQQQQHVIPVAPSLAVLHKATTSAEKLFLRRLRNREHSRKTRDRKKREQSELRDRVDMLEESVKRLKKGIQARLPADEAAEIIQQAIMMQTTAAAATATESDSSS